MNKVPTSSILHAISAMFTGACGRPEKLSLALQPRSNAVRMIVKLAYWINATFELGLFSNSFRNRLELASCAANLSILGASVIKEQRPTRDFKHEKFRWVPLNVIWKLQRESHRRKSPRSVELFSNFIEISKKRPCDYQSEEINLRSICISLGRLKTNNF